jgi:hypothetical protein
MSVEERRARVGISAEDAALIRRNIGYCAAATLAAALLLWAVSAGVNAWSGARNVSRAGQQLQQIITNFQSIYGNRPLDLGKWPTEVTAYAIGRNFLPPDMLPSNVNCRDAGSPASCQGIGPWPGSVVRLYSGQQYDAIGVVYFNLDQSACGALSSAMVKADAPLRLVVANINDSNYIFPPFGNSAFPGAADIAHDCQDGNVNKVGLMYGLK